jgi:hypothetical protein
MIGHKYGQNNAPWRRRKEEESRNSPPYWNDGESETAKKPRIKHFKIFIHFNKEILYE